MRRFIYWLRRKWRIQEKRCGQCCLICPYYEECSGDYKKEKKAKIPKYLCKRLNSFIKNPNFENKNQSLEN